MKDFGKLFVVFGLMISLAACSGSQTEEGSDILEEDFPQTEAGTDAVPEDPFANADANAEELPVSDQTPSNLDQSFAGAGSGEMIDYTVQKGDTLMKIAFETYADLYQWNRIYQLNQDKIADPLRLTAGTVLKIERPAGEVFIERNGNPYLIKVGDTLGTISSEVYGTEKKWRKIWDNNKQLIKDPNRIYAGFYLYYTFTPEDEAEKLQAAGDGRIPANGDMTVSE